MTMTDATDVKTQKTQIELKKMNEENKTLLKELILDKKEQLDFSFKAIYLNAPIDASVKSISTLTDQTAIDKLRDAYLYNDGEKISITSSKPYDAVHPTRYLPLKEPEVLKAVQKNDSIVIKNLYEKQRKIAFKELLDVANRSFSDENLDFDSGAFRSLIEDLPLDDKNYQPDVKVLAKLAINSLRKTNLDYLRLGRHTFESVYTHWLSDSLNKIKGLSEAFEKECEASGTNVPRTLSDFISLGSYEGYVHLSDILRNFTNENKDNQEYPYVSERFDENLRFLVSTPEDFHVLLGLAQLKAFSKARFIAEDTADLRLSIDDKKSFLARSFIDRDAFDRYLLNIKKNPDQSVVVASYKDAFISSDLIEKTDHGFVINKDLANKKLDDLRKSDDLTRVNQILGQDNNYGKEYENLEKSIQCTDMFLHFLNETTLSPRMARTSGEDHSGDLGYTVPDAPEHVDPDYPILNSGFSKNKDAQVQTLLASVFPNVRLQVALYGELKKRFSNKVDTKKFARALKGLVYLQALPSENQKLVLLKEDFEQFGIDPKIIFQYPEEINEVAATCQPLPIERQTDQEVNEQESQNK